MESGKVVLSRPTSFFLVLHLFALPPFRPLTILSTPTLVLGGTNLIYYFRSVVFRASTSMRDLAIAGLLTTTSSHHLK